MWSVVTSGSFELPNFAKTVRDTLDITWCDYSVGMYDVQLRVTDSAGGVGYSPILAVTRGLQSAPASVRIHSAMMPRWLYTHHMLIQFFLGRCRFLRQGTIRRLRRRSGRQEHDCQILRRLCWHACTGFHARTSILDDGW